MSGKIDKFLAKAQEVEIGGEKFMLKPFTVNDMPMMTKMGSKDEIIQSKAIQEAIFKVMKQIDLEATEEQISNVSMEFLTDIMNAISKVNNLDVDEAKAKLIERLKQ
jgi:hypothetical protein